MASRVSGSTKPPLLSHPLRPQLSLVLARSYTAVGLASAMAASVALIALCSILEPLSQGAALVVPSADGMVSAGLGLD